MMSIIEIISHIINVLIYWINIITRIPNKFNLNAIFIPP